MHPTELIKGKVYIYNQFAVFYHRKVDGIYCFDYNRLVDQNNYTYELSAIEVKDGVRNYYPSDSGNEHECNCRNNQSHYDGIMIDSEGFLCSHPGIEEAAGLSDTYVIVRRKDWQMVRNRYQKERIELDKVHEEIKSQW